ncbi:MAG: acyl-CoA dehydrogenase family protein [Hyphomonadaceae bacterium]
MADEIAPTLAARAAAHDAEDRFVAENFALLKERGFFKMHVPAELGGAGASYRETAQTIRRLANACGSTALAFSMHTHIVAVAAWRWKNDGAPTDGLLKRIAAENLLLISSGGSDWLKSAGSATKVDGGFRITAKKIFASGSPAGDILNTSAVYEDPEAGATVLHFGVPFKAEGVSIQDTWRVLGMRATGSHDVELKDVFVPDAAIAGRRPQGKWHPLFHAISLLAFPLVYSAYLGVAESARTRAIAMAKKRADETTFQTVGEMENAFAAAEIAWNDYVSLAETSRPSAEATNAAMIRRQLIGQNAIRTVERAMEAAGGASFYRDAGLERAFRDIQAARFHPLQEKPQTRFAGRMALGLDVDG